MPGIFLNHCSELQQKGEGTPLREEEMEGKQERLGKKEKEERMIFEKKIKQRGGGGKGTKRGGGGTRGGDRRRGLSKE